MISISIIIPIYNAGRSIIRCLKSVSKQTFVDYELILIDDGSKDDSYSLVHKYLDKDSKLSEKTRVYRKENSGVAKTRNYGISLAKGQYLAFIDQDDFIASDYFEALYSEIENSNKSNVDIVVGGYERIAADGRILRRITLKSSEWAGYVVTSPWAHLYRTDFIRSNEICFLDNGIGEDVYFNVVALNSNAEVVVSSNYGYKWFYNENSVSNSIQNTFSEEVDAIYLLDSIHNKLIDIEKVNGTLSDDGCLEYFFARYICWYMLYSTRGSSKELIARAYNTCFGWLRKNYPKYRRNKYLGLRQPKGENPKFHAFVFVFYLLERINILKGLLKLFGRR